MKDYGGFIYDDAAKCRCHFTTLSYGLSGRCPMCGFDLCLERRVRKDQSEKFAGRAGGAEVGSQMDPLVLE